MANKKSNGNVSVTKKVAKKSSVKVKGGKVKIAFSKKAWIAIIAILLIAAIVCVTIYFINPSLFSFGGGKTPSGELVGDVAEMHVIDVGQGDCIILRFPGKDGAPGVNMMIDAGGTTTIDGRKAEEKIVSYAKSLGISTFHHLLLTHTDADHSDYMDTVLENFEVQNIYLPDLIASNKESDDTKGQDGKVPTKVYYDVVSAANAETYSDGGTIKNASIHKNIGLFKIAGTNFDIDNYSFDAAHYRKVTYGNAHEINEVSPISIVTYGSRKICLTGDATTKSEANFINMAVNKIDVDVLKVGHHGSDSSTSQDFLNFIDAEFALISAGVGNSYNHPHKEITDRLAAYRDLRTDEDFNGFSQVHNTAEAGDIVIKIAEGNGGLSVDTTKSKEAQKSSAVRKWNSTLYANDKRSA